MIIGVLALQGDFPEHLSALQKLSVSGREVRTVADLKVCDALILPGGESTTIAKLLLSTGLEEEIRKRVKKGMPVWGTCAGAILMAKKIVSPVPLATQMNLLDIEVERNRYGSQIDSFSAELALRRQPFTAFFIRAPGIKRVGRGVRILIKHGGSSVMVQSGNLLATTFHPELHGEEVILRYFISLLEKN